MKIFTSSSLIILLLTFIFSSCSGGESTVETEETDTLSIQVDEVSNTVSDSSEITCPYCGHSAFEELPEEYCLISYTCDSCKKVLHPNEGDCCVFCTYGTHKCPSMQE